MNQEDTKTLFIDCECGSMEHVMRFIYWKGKVPIDDRVYVTIHLNSFPFWRRLVHALKYLFGYKTIYGNFEEVIIDPAKAKQISNLLSKLNP